MRAFLLLGGLTLLQAAPQLSDSYGPPLAPPVRIETPEKQCRLEKSKEFIPGKCFEGKPECQKGNCKPGPPKCRDVPENVCKDVTEKKCFEGKPECQKGNCKPGP